MSKARDCLSPAERRLLVRLFQSGAGIGGRSHPVPDFGGPESTASRLWRLGLLLPDGDHLFYLNTPVFLLARRAWRVRTMGLSLAVVLVALVALAVFSGFRWSSVF